ncbi:serine/threonine protein kinase [Aliidiomarina taiwanensis]|uniref:Serine/threonine protein kinase n=1 Tax=Aliidiomarina taiwanensis TaxID=946228 RepID=A0A432X1G8_9GAMM|nr:phosphotransferase [Aliidiomarina taiwanensis]RUO40067.1 serine/threonine protein kinase [Aliidiomarina taiwanensis]
MPQREVERLNWVRTVSTLPEPQVKMLAGDASFRRYYRVTGSHQQTEILVDAPPPEALEPFHSVALAYAKAGLQVPQVKATNIQQGFMLLEDLGDTLLLETKVSARHRYQQAIDLLPKVMSVQATRLGPLPAYDKALLEQENGLFMDWLLKKHLGLTLSDHELSLWQHFASVMTKNALEQPQVGVHRDYHSRNIMVNSAQELALIDFQDAVVGAITYDAVSLLRDCYVAWPTDFVDELMGYAYQVFQKHGYLAATVDLSRFRRWFDLMGLQRHTKASGIFARLYHRDGKPRYLGDIPQTLRYIVQVAKQYDELAAYGHWVEQKVLPLAEQRGTPCEP